MSSNEDIAFWILLFRIVGALLAYGKAALDTKSRAIKQEPIGALVLFVCWGIVYWVCIEFALSCVPFIIHPVILIGAGLSVSHSWKHRQ